MIVHVKAISSLDTGINFLPPDEKLFLARFILLFGDNWSYVSKADIAKHMKLSNSTVDKMLAKLVHKEIPYGYILEQKQYVGNGRPRQTYRLSDRFASDVEQSLPWLTRGEKPSGVIDDRRPYGLDNAIKILSAPTRYKRSGIKNVRLTDKNVLVLIFLWLYCETDKPLVKIKLSYLSEKTGLTTTDLKRELAKLKTKQLIYGWVSAGKITPSLSIEHDLFILYPTTVLLKCLTKGPDITSIRKLLDVQLHSTNRLASRMRNFTFNIGFIQKDLFNTKLKNKDVAISELADEDLSTLSVRGEIHGRLYSVLDEIGGACIGFDFYRAEHKLSSFNRMALERYVFFEMMRTTAEMRRLFIYLVIFYQVNKHFDLVDIFRSEGRKATADDLEVTPDDLIVPVKLDAPPHVELTQDLIEDFFSYFPASVVETYL